LSLNGQFKIAWDSVICDINIHTFAAERAASGKKNILTI
jgi:hypothetical protein